MTPVVPTGAAARSGEWKVDAPRLRRITASAPASAGRGCRCCCERARSDDGDGADAQTPLGLLVRPTGAVRIESVNPFSFGNARRDGLAACWERIVEGFDAPAADGVGPRLGVMGDFAKQDVVPYLDDDVPADEPTTTAAARAAALAAPLPAKAKAREPGPYATVEGALAHARELGLARGYRRGAVRISGDAHPHPGDRRDHPPERDRGRGARRVLAGHGRRRGRGARRRLPGRAARAHGA